MMERQIRKKGGVGTREAVSNLGHPAIPMGWRTEVLEA